MNWKPVVLAAGLLAAIAITFALWSGPAPSAAHVPPPDADVSRPAEGLETATFGGGCFWCTEALFLELKGVRSVTSGYSGGSVENPTYEQVSAGWTGHAEVTQIVFDPAVVSFATLLHVFWQTHDPTTLNRQGNDRGTQYRSAVFYHTDEQRKAAEDYRAKIDAAGVFAAPVVTEIVPFTAFYPAEDYHQNYYARHAGQGYPRAVIRPKLDKLKALFADKLK